VKERRCAGPLSANPEEVDIVGGGRVPPTTPDEWGVLPDVTDQATADLLVRLDAEERAADLELW